MLKPELCTNIKQKIETKKQKNCKYSNQQAKELSHLKDNDNVEIFNHNDKTWEPEEVIVPHESPRSYILGDIRDNIVRRNRQDLRLSNNTYQEACDTDLSDKHFENEPDCDKECYTSASLTQETSIFENGRTPQVVTRYGRVVKKPDRFQV